MFQMLPMADSRRIRFPNYTRKFMKRMNCVSNTGRYFNTVYLPQEIVILILSYLDDTELLKVSLVCRNWFNIVRSNELWRAKFKRRFKKTPKKLPWYVYYAYFHHDLFDTNLLQNGNGQQRFRHWLIAEQAANFGIDLMPWGADMLPANVADFNGYKSCFVMKRASCFKKQIIRLAPLPRHIINAFKPQMYVSEWMAAAAQCACTYTLTCRLCQQDEYPFLPLSNRYKWVEIKEGQHRTWTKVEVVVNNYPDGVAKIIFLHQGHFLGVWCGNGIKVAGGVVKVLFDTIKEVTDAD